MNRTVIDHLNAELATAFVLALNAKRYHWTVTGPHFRDYHLRFEELYAAADGTVDELAERIRMLGGTPLHTPAQIESETKASISNPSQRLDPEAMPRVRSEITLAIAGGQPRAPARRAAKGDVVHPSSRSTQLGARLAPALRVRAAGFPWRRRRPSTWNHHASGPPPCHARPALRTIVKAISERTLREALANEEAVIALLHEGIELSSGAGDPGTADLLTRFVQIHQKEAWFLREMLG